MMSLKWHCALECILKVRDREVSVEKEESMSREGDSVFQFPFHSLLYHYLSPRRLRSIPGLVEFSVRVDPPHFWLPT